MKAWSYYHIFAHFILSTTALAETAAVELYCVTFNDRSVRVFDPANITCTDSNGNGWIDQGECSWGDTSTPCFSDPASDTQQGNGVVAGGGGAALGQSAEMG